MKKISISIPHFYCLEYVENDKKLYMDIDFRESKILIGRSLIKRWEKPYDREEISEETREEIYQNVKKYLLERYKAEDVLEIY